MYTEINDAYVSVMGDARRARSVVEVSCLPKDALVEAELIAAIPCETGLVSDGRQDGKA